MLTTFKQSMDLIYTARPAQLKLDLEKNVGWTMIEILIVMWEISSEIAVLTLLLAVM